MARKQKMKVYHGIPKNIVDEHTLFYADYNYIRDNICYENSYYLDRGYKDSAVGLACNKVINVKAGTFDFSATPFTIDIVVENLKSGSSEDMWGCLVGLGVGTTADTNHMDKIISILNHKKNEVHSVGVFGAYVMGNELQTDDTLFIRLAYDGDKTVRGYVNGKLTGQNQINPSDLAKWTGDKNYVLCINTGHNWQGKRNNCYVSEFRISNIDRGDYFPNLPQDFIEGKAIIKPKMSQQQIKGDPAYSQITNIKVPAYVGSNTKLYVIQSDKKGTLLHNPEVFDVDSATTWQVNSSFKLKGLNNEVISGVADANTALCKITDSPSATVLKVDDVSALSVGDTFRMYRKSQSASNFSSLYTITNINTATKEVTTTEQHSTQVIQDGWICLVETTTSSSSPTVTTKEGTVVNGTWSGLGTSEAKFTLENNENIQGKDLYVEYSLVMPYGNSDFPELPSVVETAWEENGVEMKPVSEIIIIDDFRGKIATSDKQCPHRLSYGNVTDPTTHLLPNQFNQAVSQLYYGRLAEFNGDTETIACKKAGGIPQQLFSFNLIEVVERKLGCEIPGANKVQWLRNNILTFACTAYGKGVGPSGAKYVINNYYPGDKRWFNDFKTHTYATISPVTYEQSEGWISRSIDDNGFVHFLVYTDASSASVQSAIATDYVRIRVKLKVPTAFTALYCENTRAREDKCNPILIQNETKTVRRYLPSKAPFATEYKYIQMKKQAIDHDILNNAFDNSNSYATTQGTGSYATNCQLWRYKNIINLLNLGLINPYEYNNEGLYTNPFTAKIHTTFISERSDGYIGNNLRFMPCQSYDVPKYLVFKPYITAIGGELKLSIASSEVTRSTAGSSYASQLSKSEFAAFELPNRPLIK